MRLVHVAGDTYYVPGPTNIGVHRDYIIDPGKNELVDWSNPRESFGRDFSVAVITHGHTDHFWHAAEMRGQGVKVYAPAGETPMIEDMAIHTNGLFCWARPPEGMKPWYLKGIPCKVDGHVEDLDMPLKVVPLKGHTDWHVGYLTPDGVLMAGDAIVAKKLWDTAGMVCYTDIPRARGTLRNIMDTGADYVLPSHTDLLSREEAVALAEVNLEGIDRLERLVIGAVDKAGVSTEDVVCRACNALGMRDEFSVHLVGETTVRALLHALQEQGIVDYELKGHKVLWHTT